MAVIVIVIKLHFGTDMLSVSSDLVRVVNIEVSWPFSFCLFGSWLVCSFSMLCSWQHCLLLCFCMLCHSIFSFRKMRSLPSAEDPVRLSPSASVYRKLMWHSRSRVLHNMDIAPNICMAFMIVVILYTVSLFGYFPLCSQWRNNNNNDRLTAFDLGQPG